jgi:photosystem II stability/assembly factor-like uncharacterized protein
MEDLMRHLRFARLAPIVALALLPFGPSLAAEDEDEEPDPNVTVDPDLYGEVKFRMIGPYRGGRVTAVAGIRSQPFTFYMGPTGGGVWKTTNAGESWTNVSDEDLHVGSIGAIEVAGSDPNVVYVGTGSACPRGNVSVGDGVYRSTDAGKSWAHRGLPEAGLIGRIRVHPRDPDLVYVAVLGHAFGRNEERGVYRSKDGGATWEKVLFVSDGTGAVDLAMNPRNPRELYAALWRFERKPWTLVDGSTEGGVYKTTDGGDTWDKVKGLPPFEDAEEDADGAMVGRIGVSVSPVNPDRVFALVTAKGQAGGLYRSDDAGESWKKVNSDRRLLTRGWYYTHIYADPADENTVWSNNVRFLKSIDGGKTFGTLPTLHGDNHDMWINPDTPDIMIQANDGGAHVSLDGARTWSTLHNQPTAEFYRVTVDDQFPYRVYGAQQDNSTISVSSRPPGTLAPGGDWYEVGGGESGHIAVDPRNPELVYSGNYIGQIDRYDRGTGTSRNVILYPQMADGVAPKDLKYRFQWNAPILISPHDPDVVYHASQHVHRTRDGGATWETISPDLTRNDPEKQPLPGGPIQHDHTGVEIYSTVFSLSESTLAKGELWAGTDDGRIHLSRDDGATWTDITPADMPEGGTVNVIDVSRRKAGRAHVAVYKYREDDFRPYVFATEDYGASWKLLTDGKNGIPESHFVRAVREDPDREALLYAGTEFGLYVSFDAGKHWQTLQLNLPRVPVTDLAVHQGDLVVATQGRSFWVLDGLTLLHQMTNELSETSLHLFAPRPAHRRPPTSFFGEGYPGRSPDRYKNGAHIHYLLAEEVEEDSDQELKLEILDASGQLVRSLSNKPEAKPRKRRPRPATADEDRDEPSLLPAKKGLNRFVWDLRTKKLRLAEGAVMSLGYTGGYFVAAGTYTARLTLGDQTRSQEFEVLLDPNVPDVSREDLEKQQAFVKRIVARFDETHDAIRHMRRVREQLDDAVARARAAGIESEDLAESAKTLSEKLTAIEDELIQTKNEAGQDPLNFPSKLDDQLAFLYGHVALPYGGPDAGSSQRLADIEAALQPHLDAVRKAFAEDVPAFNAALVERGAVGILVPSGAE